MKLKLFFLAVILGVIPAYPQLGTTIFSGGPTPPTLGNHASNNAAAASVVVTVNSSTNHLIVVGVCDAVGTQSYSVADSAGNTYTATPSGRVKETNSNRGCEIFYTVSIGAVTSVTPSRTSNTGTMYGFVLEYSGNNTSAPFDKDANAINSNITAWTGGTTAALTHAGEVCTGLFEDNVTLTATGGYTTRESQSTTQIIMTDLGVTTLTAQSATATAASNSFGPGITACFKGL